MLKKLSCVVSEKKRTISLTADSEGSGTYETVSRTGDPSSVITGRYTGSVLYDMTTPVTPTEMPFVRPP